MSKNFEKFKRYYDSGLWNEERVRNVMLVGAITKDEYELITGKNFEE